MVKKSLALGLVLTAAGAVAGAQEASANDSYETYEFTPEEQGIVNQLPKDWRIKNNQTLSRDFYSNNNFIPADSKKFYNAKPDNFVPTKASQYYDTRGNVIPTNSKDFTFYEAFNKLTKPQYTEAGKTSDGKLKAKGLEKKSSSPSSNSGEGLALTLDAGIVLNSENKIVGSDGKIGVEYDFGPVGIGANIGLGKTYEDGTKTIASYEGKPSATTGRKAKGTITRETQKGIRQIAEVEAKLRLSPVDSEIKVSLIGKGGLVLTPISITEKTIEQIIGKTGNVLKENSYSTSNTESEIDLFGGVGFGIKAGKLEYRILIGGENGKGFYSNVGIAIPLGVN